MQYRCNWASSACVTWALFSGLSSVALLACSGGGGGDGVTVTPGVSGEGGGSNGNAGSGNSSAGTSGFVDVDPDPGCSGASCAGAGGSAGSGAGTSCGNGSLEALELCDDGNAQPGDGCTGACNIEPNFACAEVGQPCTSTIACGDGQVGGAEACDDANIAADDGCSASCQVELGFGCTTGQSGSVCIPDATIECGDSVVGAGEQCDDGNVAASDGCSAVCQVETGHVCPVVGQPCEQIAYCGDGFLNDAEEQCDDGNRSPADGCDGACNIQPNFTCPTPGQPCASTIVCGDAQITGNETCDDGDATAGDGCSSLCRVEPGFDCTGGGLTPVPGNCTPVPEERCGDAALAPTELCDDGNQGSLDGCSSACSIEPGYDCPDGPGALCVRVGTCGDGLVNVVGEQCDDGNDDGGDGCTASCLREALFSCPAQGGPCTSDVECGDSLVNGPETCDDGDTLGGDGCNASCQTEPGFVCAVGGVCRPVCGDGIRAGREACDDGDTAGGDGCDATCRLEQGFECTTPNDGADVCSRTVCGDGTKEGTEQCDDSNLVPYDGCDDQCRNEPRCSRTGGEYSCAAVCGDGMKFPEEACDDGNTLSDDGCSATCRLEAGYVCSNEAPDLGSQLDLPVIYRDFRDNHPHFEITPASASGTGLGVLTRGIVSSTLGANGKPAYNTAFSFDPDGGGSVSARAWTMDGRDPAGSAQTPLSAATIATRFGEWYVTDGTNNRAVIDTLPLIEQGAAGSGIYRFSATGTSQFFPLDGIGFGNQGRAHNFHFTSEVRQWFEYQGGEKLEFSGDDDVWVFVNGQLTVDLGGIHNELFGSIELLGDGGEDSVLCLPTGAGGASVCSAFPVDMNDGVNEIAVFQAERHVTQSNYTLTLRGFNAPLTVCQSDCGDGVVTADEACDLGSAGNTGEYDTCNDDCTLTPRCGDGQIDAADGELCDNGLNTDTRLVASGDCAPGCVLPPSCGDGNIDGQFLEQCDSGDDNTSVGTYGACDDTCQLGPRCGDGVLQAGAGEQCDQGQQNGSGGSACLSDCRLRCGNGVVDQGEQCDAGRASNTGAYGGCESDCSLAPRCGDAVVDQSAGEACDDGLNDGSYGTCGVGCQPGPFCGDGALQAAAGEVCDEGAQNLASGYGAGLCSTRCEPAPYCGDHAVNADKGEVCDDGVNDGRPGSCAPDCKSAVGLPSCGDGQVDPGEDCDHGARNGKRGDSCDVRCGNACGNGFVDATEQCDDGVNDGSYGSCKPDCTFAAFCGDGVTTGPEACDDGASNVAPGAAYGDGVCTTGCALASRCGDGRVDASFGEACDGSPSCTSACNILR